MKTTILSLCILSLLISCKKSNQSNDPGQDPVSESYPQIWLLTYDGSVDKYTHLELAGNSMKRSEIEKTYNLITLAKERYCSFIVSEDRTEFTHKLCFKIQFENQKKRWLFAGPSSNKLEVHLSTTSGSSEISDPGGDGYKFFVHNLPKVNGVKTVAIESVDQPGYYISVATPGQGYSPTQVVLTKETGPEKATPWQCR
jgi:hypothetical protein